MYFNMITLWKTSFKDYFSKHIFCGKPRYYIIIYNCELFKSLLFYVSLQPIYIQKNEQ